MTPAPEPRIGDAERDAAVTALGEHFAAGRLTKEEYDERSEAALRARTNADLRPLFADLPRTGPPGAPHGREPRRRRGWRSYPPVVPVLAVLAIVLAVTHWWPWWLFFVGVWFFCWGPRHRWR